VRDELIHRLFDPPEAFRRLPASEQARLRDAMLATVIDARPPPPERRSHNPARE